jgi:hypothetical protein
LPEAMQKAKELIIIGNEKIVTEKLIHFIDTVGPFGTLLLTGHDMTNTEELWKNSFTAMSKSIQPILSKYMEQKF